VIKGDKSNGERQGAHKSTKPHRANFLHVHVVLGDVTKRDRNCAVFFKGIHPPFFLLFLLINQ
jgi:hypothetical protein